MLNKFFFIINTVFQVSLFAIFDAFNYNKSYHKNTNDST